MIKRSSTSPFILREEFIKYARHLPECASHSTSCCGRAFVNGHRYAMHEPEESDRLPCSCGLAELIGGDL